MTTPDAWLDATLAFAVQIAHAAGAAILPHFRSAIDVQNKLAGSGYDPVTIADRAAETVIRDAIRRTYPGHGLLGEEHGYEQGSERWTWVIDPIDGTKSFILGHLHWATLIALNDGIRPVLGVTYQPFVGEAFVAMHGAAAWWQRGNERRELRTRACPSPADAIVATTDPRFFTGEREARALAVATEGTRFVRYGGDCYCYTQLAMGLIDVAMETGLKPYDIQSLIPLIESAGGVITDWKGGTCYQGGDVLACGDPILHDKLLKRLAGA